MGAERIGRAFAKAKQEKRSAFIAFVTAGHPSVSATRAIVHALCDAGADIIELGIPFSDPLADGPTIQAASSAALKQGMTTRKYFHLIRQLRYDGIQAPLVGLGYVNPLARYGYEPFARDAVSAGLDGLIVPDLPPEEAGDWIRAARRRKLATVFLAAPTSPPARLRRIAQSATGFIYCVSLTGVTGARRSLPQEAAGVLRRLRRITTTPLAVGFGVSKADQVRWFSRAADGVIVGSAIVQAIMRAQSRGVNPAKAAGSFIKPLVEATRK